MKKSRKLDHVVLLNIFLIYNIEELWTCLANSDKAQLIFYSHAKNQFHTPTLSLDIGH